MAVLPEIPTWVRLTLLAAFIGLAYLIVTLAGSKHYARRVPNAVKIVLAFVLSQAANVYFLPLMQLVNVLPPLLSGRAYTIADYAGQALGLIWSVPCAVTIAYALMPRNRAGLLFGLLSFLMAIAFQARFAVLSYQEGYVLTAVFGALSILFGVAALCMALLRRKRKKRA